MRPCIRFLSKKYKRIIAGRFRRFLSKKYKRIIAGRFRRFLSKKYKRIIAGRFREFMIIQCAECSFNITGTSFEDAEYQWNKFKVWDLVDQVSEMVK
jgi:hypothetical protein